MSFENKKNYKDLNKSKLTPPGFIFGIVWTFLYFLLAIYFVLGITTKGTSKALVYFIIQIAVNLSWTYVFFNKNFQKLAFIMILLMILFTCLSFYEMFKVNKVASYLLIPYIMWLSFATYLNGYIIFKN